MRRIGILVISGSMLLGCQPRQHVPVNPFQIPPAVFFDSVRTIVVTTASVVGEIEVHDSTLSYLESLIEEKLLEADINVVPAVEYAQLWDSIAIDVGGFFDPYTGERDEEMYLAAVDQLMTELSERYAYDALLYPEIWEVLAPFESGDARWGGMAQVISGGRGYSGEVLATTLFVAIQDSAGTELYVKEAGIQVLEYMRDGTLTPLPTERLFADTTWIVAAVLRVLDPLINREAPVQP